MIDQYDRIWLAYCPGRIGVDVLTTPEQARSHDVKGWTVVEYVRASRLAGSEGALRTLR